MNSSLYVENSAIVSLSVSLRQRLQALLLPNSWNFLRAILSHTLVKCGSRAGMRATSSDIIPIFCYSAVWGLIATYCGSFSLDYYESG